MYFEGTPPPASSFFRFEKIEGGIWFGLKDSIVSKGQFDISKFVHVRQYVKL